MSLSLTAERSAAMPVPGNRFVFLALALALMGFAWLGVEAATSRGPWLDEFWTLWLSERGIPAHELLLDRWMADLHPPLFSMVHWAFGVFGDASYVSHRLLNLLPLAWACGFVGFAAARYPRSASTLCALVVGWLAIGTTTEYFAEMRSYFSQMATLLVLVSGAVVIVEADGDFDRRDDFVLAAFSVFNILVVFNLNYLSLAVGGLTLLSLGALLWLSGKRRWFWILFGWSVAGLIPVVVFVLAQKSTLVTASDNYWVTSTFGEAVAIMRRVAQRAGESNEAIVVSVLLCLAASVMTYRRARRSPTLPSGETISLRQTDIALFVVFAMAAVAFAAILLAAHLRSPIITGRYLLGWQVVVLGALVMLSAPVWRRMPVLLLALALAGVVHQAGASRMVRSDGRWDVSLELLRHEIQSCPSSRVYAARFSRPGLMQHETDVRRFAHLRMAEWNGIRLQFIDPEKGEQLAAPDARAGECPTLLWLEHVSWRAVPRDTDAETVLRYLGLSAEPFLLTESSVLVGDTGMVLVLPPR